VGKRTQSFGIIRKSISRCRYLIVALRRSIIVYSKIIKIKIFSVGGTIDKVYFDSLSQYQVGFPSVREILDNLPIAFEYEIESVLRKDSLDMTDEDRQLLYNRVCRDANPRILITHGTDTMVQSAKMFIGTDKTVVFTGAMEPANFKSSDAVFNIGCAIGALQTLPNGAYIVMNGKVFTPDACVKDREKGIFKEK